jgi:hypothetical protein
MSAEQKKRPEDYRRLADLCRQAARVASTDKERNNLAGQSENLRLPGPA